MTANFVSIGHFCLQLFWWFRSGGLTSIVMVCLRIIVLSNIKYQRVVGGFLNMHEVNGHLFPWVQHHYALHGRKIWLRLMNYWSPEPPRSGGGGHSQRGCERSLLGKVPHYKLSAPQPAARFEGLATSHLPICPVRNVQEVTGTETASLWTKDKTRKKIKRGAGKQLSNFNDAEASVKPYKQKESLTRAQLRVRNIPASESPAEIYIKVRSPVSKSCCHLLSCFSAARRNSKVSPGDFPFSRRWDLSRASPKSRRRCCCRLMTELRCD